MRNKIYIYVILVFIFIIGCDYEQTTIEYDTKQQEIYITNKPDEIFIKRFQIIIGDSLKLNYPNKMDTVKRNRISIPKYFGAPNNLLYKKEVTFYIRAGVKSTGNAFDVCMEKLFLDNNDTIIRFKCLGR